ncbi:MAG TPA: aminomethyl-transferring glycine dehydrogenase subunit GcvPB, partial [Bacillota bacterium]|nr:aminomethyl-transferring glycine dehydrogenase subunit GcvPB [Bacillota bacterium]
MNQYDKLIFELSGQGKKGYRLPACDVGERAELPEHLRRQKELGLPQVTEPEAVRHYTQLSMKNYGLDGGFYPLGSCTMKYNPKINEDAAAMAGFRDLHPYQPESTFQGALELMYELDGMLSEITGMEKFSLQPAAGAHGELTGLMMIKAYHDNRGDGKRKKIIVPDSSHGTNPASAAEAGFE